MLMAFSWGPTVHYKKPYFLLIYYIPLRIEHNFFSNLHSWSKFNLHYISVINTFNECLFVYLSVFKSLDFLSYYQLNNLMILLFILINLYIHSVHCRLRIKEHFRLDYVCGRILNLILMNN